MADDAIINFEVGVTHKDIEEIKETTGIADGRLNLQIALTIGISILPVLKNPIFARDEKGNFVQINSNLDRYMVNKVIEDAFLEASQAQTVEAVKEPPSES